MRRPWWKPSRPRPRLSLITDFFRRRCVVYLRITSMTGAEVVPFPGQISAFFSRIESRPCAESKICRLQVVKVLLPPNERSGEISGRMSRSD